MKAVLSRLVCEQTAPTRRLLLAIAIASLGGCMVPASQYTASETQNRVLTEQNRAQLTEIENLRVHAHQAENDLARAEQQLASMKQETDNARRTVQHAKRETDRWNQQSNQRLPTAISEQLVQLSLRYPSLNFDPVSGVSKLDTDVLFDSGQTELKPAARALLSELANILQTAEARDLRVMVVGHTDNQPIVGRSTREKFANNFHLSTGRALAVADLLKGQGLADRRIGVAGFGPHEPIVANDEPGARQKNRRVEIFVMPPEAPVIGWNDTIPGAYY